MISIEDCDKNQMKVEKFLNKLEDIVKNADNLCNSLSVTFEHSSNLLNSYTSLGEYIKEKGGDMSHQGVALIQIVEVQTDVNDAGKKFVRKFTKLMTNNLKNAFLHWKYKFDVQKKEFLKTFKPYSKKFEKYKDKLHELEDKIDSKSKSSSKDKLVKKFNKVSIDFESSEEKLSTALHLYNSSNNNDSQSIVLKNLFVLQKTIMLQKSVYKCMEKLDPLFTAYTRINTEDPFIVCDADDIVNQFKQSNSHSTKEDVEYNDAYSIEDYYNE